jgi:hypothetical protein
MHVDEFIDHYKSDAYAAYYLSLLRTPAGFMIRTREFWYEPGLYCTHEGTRYRVVFASRMGWVGVTVDFTKDTYDKSVAVDECSEWSKGPGVAAAPAKKKAGRR